VRRGQEIAPTLWSATAAVSAGRRPRLPGEPKALLQA